MINLPDNKTKSYALPAATNTGSTITVRNQMTSDSLDVSVFISPELLANNKSFYLIGQYGALVCYARPIRSSGRMKVDKKLFSTGIAKFTLLNNERQPVNERIVYIDLKDKLDIRILPDKPFYSTHDSIALRVEVKDKDGKPVRGSFSVSVTDDNQVKTDTISNIRTNLLLTSDLKGTVEDPSYYFAGTVESWQALENLMLTQGWVIYNSNTSKEQGAISLTQWMKNPKILPQFAAESEFTVKGKVVNIFNKSLDGTTVAMISTNPLFVKDTITDASGIFRFNGFPQIDSAAFRIQATNKRDKSMNVQIKAEEFQGPLFANESYQTIPWYVNPDTTLLNYVNSTITQKQEEFKYMDKDNVLGMVTITAKKIVKGSKNLNGEGGADLTIDEEELKKSGKKTLLELLQERIPQWSLRIRTRARMPISIITANSIYSYRDSYYAVNGTKANIIIDGIEIDYYYSENPDFYMPDQYYQYVKEYLDYFSAEDTKGIEFMKPGKYTAKYNSTFKRPILKPGTVVTTVTGQTRVSDSGNALHMDLSQSFIEITTRNGRGPWSMPTPGTYLYKAMPFAGTREFYRPKYIVKSKSALLPDLRSTIHWEPNVVTDSEGRGVVSFYTADKTGTYTVIAEGADMTGNLGVETGKITVKP